MNSNNCITPCIYLDIRGVSLRNFIKYSNPPNSKVKDTLLILKLRLYLEFELLLHV
jgi:hypothetical protein